MTRWNRAQDAIHIFQRETEMTRIVWICDVVLMHRLCHRARYNLLHRRNIYVHILSHDEIIESSAGACISISVNVLSSWIRKQRWHLFFSFCGRPGISNLWRVTRAWPRRCHLRNQSLRRFCQPSGIECVHVHKRHNFISAAFNSLVTCCAIFCSTGCEPNWDTLFPLSPYSSRSKPSNTFFRQNLLHDPHFATFWQES